MRRRGRGDGANLPRRELRRESDGSLYDIDERRRVPLAELRDEVRVGRRFRAFRHDTASDCTNEVLVELLENALPVAGRGELGAVTGLLRVVTGEIVDVLDDRRERDDHRRDRSGLARRRRPVVPGPAGPEPD